MTLGKRLREARKQAGYTQRELALKIGAKHNSVSNWEHDLNRPDPDLIERLCRVLDTTPNYLLMGGVEEERSAPRYSVEERELILRYRGLNGQARGALHALLDYYAANGERKHTRPTAPGTVPALQVISGLVSTQSVAAGTGTYLDADSFEEIRLADNAWTRRAAFYVPVSGNSMEPRFHDGDLLMIEKSAVRKGDIGIFTLHNQGYVKVLGDRELLSLNPDYAPIPMDESISCNGKVIGVVDPAWLMGES